MIQTIKLSQLVPSKRNVRRRSDTAADAQLRADSEPRGLLQNLIVTADKTPRGTFAVEAGGRRHAALKTLADEGRGSARRYDPARRRRPPDAKMLVMEQRKRDLEAFLAKANEPPPPLHPKMANCYRRQVDSLHEALQFGPEATRLKAADMLRVLLSTVTLIPNDDGWEVVVQGDLAGILAIASNAKSSRARGGRAVAINVVTRQYVIVPAVRSGQTRDR